MDGVLTRDETYVGGDQDCAFSGKIFARSSHQSKVIEYDIAIGVADSVGSSFGELQVANSPVALSGFGDATTMPWGSKVSYSAAVTSFA